MVMAQTILELYSYTQSVGVCVCVCAFMNVFVYVYMSGGDLLDGEDALKAEIYARVKLFP
jgi:hypothetical protein